MDPSSCGKESPSSWIKCNTWARHVISCSALKLLVTVLLKAEYGLWPPISMSNGTCIPIRNSHCSSLATGLNCFWCADRSQLFVRHWNWTSKAIFLWVFLILISLHGTVPEMIHYLPDPWFEFRMFEFKVNDKMSNCVRQHQLTTKATFFYSLKFGSFNW